MKRIDSLNIKKLIKELEYVESNYNYLVEAIHESDMAFIKEVNLFVESNPIIKNKYENHNISINTNLNEKVSVNDNNKELTSIEIPKKIKKLYREIAKITHPDKVSNKKYNEIYINALNAYNNLDIIKLYSICDYLNIEYEIEIEEQIQIKDRIKNTKDKINLLESTISWRWFNCNDDLVREEIISKYINNIIK